MLKWFGSKKAPTLQHRCAEDMVNNAGGITDDPLAIIDLTGESKKIYSVSRINPIYDDENNVTSLFSKDTDLQLGKKYGKEKSCSSGYGGSHQEGSQEPLYADILKLQDDSISILEQNEDYVKSIRIGSNKKCMLSHRCSFVGTSNLSVIPEGKTDCSVPSPVWPNEGDLLKQSEEGFRDSLVDETLLLYTSFNYVPNDNDNLDVETNLSVKELLLELSNYVNEVSESKNCANSDQILKSIKEKIAASLEILKNCTEEEVKRLCINLSNKAKSNSVLRAFSNNSSCSSTPSESSSQSSPKWNGERARTCSSETEDRYRAPSGSSSSGFSDNDKQVEASCSNRLLVLEEFNCDQHCLRNALIYATLCRTNLKLLRTGETFFERNKRNCSPTSSSNNGNPKKNLLGTAYDNKPSIWEQYYGVTMVPSRCSTTYVPKPTDVPLYPGGRPEADFTLDLPRSEFLNKKMKEEKNWRCRCRVLTSFLGLVFFLLSVMAVSLILTRGKKLFGSMI